MPRGRKRKATAGDGGENDEAGTARRARVDEDDGATAPEQQADLDAELAHFTVKTGLRCFVQLQGEQRDRFLGSIDDTVRVITQLAYEVSRFVNFYAVRCLEQGRPFAGDFGSNAFYYKIACSLSSCRGRVTPCADRFMEQQRQAYLRARGNLDMLPLPARDRAVHNVNYLALDLARDARNHIITNLWRRLRRWILLKLEDVVLADEQQPLATQIMEDLSGGEALDTAKLQRKVGVRVMQIRQLLRDVPPADSGNRLAKHEVKKHLMKWITVLWRIGLDFREALAEGGRRGVRAFSLLPQADYVARHIVLDRKSAFLELLKKAEVPGVPTGNWESTAQAEQFHASVFKIWRLTSGRKAYRYAYFLRTDGVAVSVTLLRRRHPNDGGDGSDDEEGNGRGGEVFEGPRDLPPGSPIIGLDPGRRSLFHTVCRTVVAESCAAVPGPAAAPVRVQNAKCSNRHYRALCGTVNRQRKVEAWMTREGLKEHLEGVPSCKVVTSGELKVHIEYSFQHLSEVMRLFGSRQYKKHRQNGFYRKNAALEHLAKMVTGGRRDAIVAYGAAKFGSCVRGNPPVGLKAMLRRLQQRCTVFLVDEHRTSRVCSIADCNGELELMKGHVWDRSQQPPVRREKRFWAVQRCTLCGMVWNRDHNAATNILNVFLSICATGKRPEPFRHRNAPRAPRAGQ